jgi:CYTH domain-containing protein
LTETWDSISVKGPRYGVARAEEEWPLSAELAASLFRLAPYKLVKSRYQFVYGDFLWELDQFHHRNEGLFIAECEVEQPGMNPPRPPWCHKEITGDTRYDNEQLAMNPFATW